MPDASRPACVRQLRLAGVSYRQIAEDTGWDDPRRLMASQTPEPDPDELQLELDRLEALQAHHWGQSAQGLYQATGLIVQIMTLRARLKGWLKADGAPNAHPTGRAEQLLSPRDALAMIPPPWLEWQVIPPQLHPSGPAEHIPSEAYLEAVVTALPAAWLSAACPYRRGT
jgi:hypothetical protein